MSGEPFFDRRMQILLLLLLGACILAICEIGYVWSTLL